MHLPDRMTALEGLLGSANVPEAYVRLRMDVLRIQVNAFESLSRSSSAPHAPEFPLASGAIAFPSDVLREMLSGMQASLHGMGKVLEDSSRLLAADRAGSDLLPELARNCAFGLENGVLASISRRIGISLAGLVWLGRLLAAPVVTHAVRACGGCRDGPEDSPSGHCPFCNSTPGLAWLRRADGRRLLCCSLCGSLWLSGRIDCPFCGDARNWNRLAAGEDDPRWVEACTACGLYLKITDERKLAEDSIVMPLVEAVASLDLDIIAGRHGWRESPPYAALT